MAIQHGTTVGMKDGTDQAIQHGTTVAIQHGTTVAIQHGTTVGLSETSIKSLPIEVIPYSEVREHFTVETRFEIDFSEISNQYANQNFRRGQVRCEVKEFRISPSFHDDKKILTVILDISHPFYVD